MTFSIYILEMITYITIAYVCLQLTPRLSIVSISTSLLLYISWYVYSFTTTTAFPVSFVLMIIMCILLKEKIYLSICVVIASALTMNITSNILSFAIFVFNPSFWGSTLNTIYISSIIALLIMIVVSFMIRFRFKDLPIIIHSLGMCQCIVIISLCIFDFFLSAMTGLLMKQYLNQSGRYLLIVTIYLTIVTSIVLLVLYLRLRRLNLLLYDSNLTNMKLLKLEENHFKTIQKKNMDLRAFKHDYNHHINTLQWLISNEPDKIIPYIQNMAEIKEHTQYISCNNPVADSVVNYYYEEFLNNDVLLEVTGAFPEHIVIEDSDLCVIISNMLSNAYDEIMRLKSEAAQNLVVYCSIFILDDYIEICVENSSHEYNETAITTTSKPDTVNHGFGLKNISRVAKKYNGRLSITCSNNMFKTSVFVNYRKTG